MRTECKQARFEFHGLFQRKVKARFDGGKITSDAGVLLLREVERGTGLIAGLAECFRDHRDPRLIEHTVEELLGQRIYGLCLGYEDLNDHDQLRTDPMLAVAVTRPDQVWCTDVTYIPMRRGFLYLVAIMDWYSRWVLSWRLSNTLEPSFCCEALEEALNRYDPPEIFNTDQGSQFTSTEFTGLLKGAGVRISMDGRGRWMDNVFIERLWRSLKYECVYLNAFETGSEARQGIGHWIDLYNSERPHSAHAGATPEEVYTGLKKHSERDLALSLALSQNFPYWRQQELRSPP